MSHHVPTKTSRKWGVAPIFGSVSEHRGTAKPKTMGKSMFNSWILSILGNSAGLLPENITTISGVTTQPLGTGRAIRFAQNVLQSLLTIFFQIHPQTVFDRYVFGSKYLLSFGVWKPRLRKQAYTLRTSRKDIFNLFKRLTILQKLRFPLFQSIIFGSPHSFPS